MFRIQLPLHPFVAESDFSVAVASSLAMSLLERIYAAMDGIALNETNYRLLIVIVSSTASRSLMKR